MCPVGRKGKQSRKCFTSQGLSELLVLCTPTFTVPSKKSPCSPALPTPRSSYRGWCHISRVFIAWQTLSPPPPPGKSACHIFGGNQEPRAFRAKFIQAPEASQAQGGQAGGQVMSKTLCTVQFCQSWKGVKGSASAQAATGRTPPLQGRDREGPFSLTVFRGRARLLQCGTSFAPFSSPTSLTPRPLH